MALVCSRLQLLVQNNPENAQLHRYLSLAQWNSGRKEDSLRTIKRAAALNQDFAADAELRSSTFDGMKAKEAAALAENLKVKEEV